MNRIFFGGLLTLLAAVALGQSDYAQVVKVNGNFDDIKDSLVLAIERQGLVINSTSHVGSMLERTGRDIGNDKRIYKNAEVIEFCSAKVSRAVMETDPKAIVLCPYSISIYTLPGKAETVFLAYRKFPIDASVKHAADLVEGIVEDAIR